MKRSGVEDRRKKPWNESRWINIDEIFRLLGPGLVERMLWISAISPSGVMVNSLNRLEAMYTQDEFPYLANAKARVHINIHF